ncbi:Rv3654c family TadE-like protein [Amycolatopsis suaedae]|uniref:Helicase n=1 Tax=Amycolatopsis suaedae TaxID=2510978 RepID=A0A4Q7J478_9PSEU|nr:Rv3654c family TadE-like protein [Amycolatopsis suaedae]RZQ61608.1 hypothetical protein EWH70_21800 [Amycolatopsis suaedae]
MATVWAAGAVAAVLGVGVVVIWLGSAVLAVHRAGGAADLAALAAAGRAASGAEAACGRARTVAERMGVELAGCRLVDWDALVEVRAPVPGPLDEWGTAHARARAGPVDRPG